MDKKLIQEKPESLRRCVQRIETKRPKKVDELEEFKTFAKEINEEHS